MKKKIIAGMVLMGILLCGCTQQDSKVLDSKHMNEVFVATAGDYNSADTAVVIRVDEANSNLTLKNLDVGKQYTLSYDGMTNSKDKYDESIAMAQIMPGDIVDLTFLKEEKRLNSIKISPKAWVYDEVKRFAIDETGKSMSIANEHLAVDKYVSLVSEEKQVEMMDINENDLLTVKGIDRTVLSITVNKGHGYLRLSNDEYFVGGWIEVGDFLVQPIEEDMLITLPEGKYPVLVSHKGSSGIKEVTIVRNGETELDIGDLKGEEIQMGKVIFSISPTNATVQIDGKPADISTAIAMEYGIHEMLVKAEGYRTIRQYIKVGQEMATISVEMEEISKEEETVSSNQVSGNKTPNNGNNNNNNSNNNTTSGNNANNGNANGNTNGSVSGNGTNNGSIDASTSYRVKIEEPKGTEVYIDGNYIGIAPIDFKKTEGNHSVTLRKEGHQTRSYTIQVDKEKKDISFSFSDLTKIE